MYPFDSHRIRWHFKNIEWPTGSNLAEVFPKNISIWHIHILVYYAHHARLICIGTIHIHIIYIIIIIIIYLFEKDNGPHW
jgi:hypothetical protein